MYLVDKEHVVLVERGEDAGQVAGLVEHGARRHLEAHSQLVGNDVAQCGLAQAWRTVKQDVVECLVAHAGRSDKHAQVVDDFVLTGKIVKLHGTQGFLKVLVALLARVPDVEVFVHVLLIDAQNY